MTITNEELTQRLATALEAEVRASKRPTDIPAAEEARKARQEYEHAVREFNKQRIEEKLTEAGLDLGQPERRTEIEEDEGGEKATADDLIQAGFWSATMSLDRLLRQERPDEMPEIMSALAAYVDTLEGLSQLALVLAVRHGFLPDGPTDHLAKALEDTGRVELLRELAKLAAENRDQRQRKEALKAAGKKTKKR